MPHEFQVCVVHDFILLCKVTYLSSNVADVFTQQPCAALTALVRDLSLFLMALS